MHDSTENIRREMCNQIADQVQSSNKETERERLKKEYGEVWDTQELQRDFEVTGFFAPVVVVKRRSDGQVGSLVFQHDPRFYFAWQEDK